jgi:2-succinyl-6-hydroxy-2,4-cyclohexadiene-1-carboxylate synthase
VTSTLVLLHGFTGTPRSFDRIVGLLGARSALVPFLTGHGPEPLARVDGFEAEVDRLARLVRGARLPPARLVGYSLGARLALGLLVRHPTLFADAVLVGAQPGLAEESQRAARRQADEEWCRVLEGRGIDAFIAGWQAQALFASQAGLPAARLEDQRRERLTHTAAGLIHSLRSTGLGVMPCYAERLQSIAHPVRLVVGELDAKFRALGDDMACTMPHARLDVVPSAGHNIVLERPAALAALIGAREAAA